MALVSADAHLHTHGGLTPAALACVFGQPLDNVRFSRYSVRFTEPRRADTRRSCERAFVHRECRYFSGDWRRASRSGWRKPAVAHHPIVRGECNHSAKTDRHCRCGSPNHGGLTRDALFGQAFVHRKNRYSPTNVRSATQERGALAPRGVNPRASSKREIPRIAIADAVCTPTAG